jgi:elongation factor Ts
MLKRQGNVTAEGRVFTRVRDDGSEGVMVEIQCESAPVSGGEDLGRLGEMLATQLLDGPGAETADDLLAQPAPDGSGMTLKEVYERLVATIREKIVVTRVIRVAGPVAAYVHHDGKSGVLFQAEGEQATAPVLRDVAMHVAGLRPDVVNPEELDPSVVQAERDRLTEEAKATGKPDNIIDKIVDGRMKNFYVEEGVLTRQAFAKDDSKSVSQALAEHGMAAKAFTCWVIGD